ncbi:MAG: hypothetical protein AAF550_08015 [Myxococcota bacterium]
MSTESIGQEPYRIPAQSRWANAWKVPAAFGAFGVLVSALGWVMDPERFAFSWLFAFFYVATVALGSLFYVIAQHVTGADWGTSVRRTAEFLMLGVPLLAVLFLPNLANMHFLWGEWIDASAGHGHHDDEHHGSDGGHDHSSDHTHGGKPHGSRAPLGVEDASKTAGQAHDAPSSLGALVGGIAHAQTAHLGGGSASVDSHAVHEDGHSDGEHHTVYEQALHHEILQKKTAYLNLPFWLIRAAAYFFIWTFISLLYFRWSTQQDRSRDLGLTLKMKRFAPASGAAFALTLTFAAFDWAMALEPAWYSTIFGVYIFAGCVVSMFAAVILLALGLVRAGYLGRAVNVEHFHDLGKMMFGFTCFWAYIGFSQFLLIWYAGIPEEATYYHLRWDSQGWKLVSIFLMAGHFIFPFIFLVSRVPKRNLSTLAFACVWMLFMHAVDMYWFILPNYGALDLHWMDVGALLAALGIYLAYVFYRMGQFPLVPLGDPRLNRSIHHVQTT